MASARSVITCSFITGSCGGGLLPHTSRHRPVSLQIMPNPSVKSPGGLDWKIVGPRTGRFLPEGDSRLSRGRRATSIPWESDPQASWRILPSEAPPDPGGGLGPHRNRRSAGRGGVLAVAGFGHGLPAAVDPV